ncbi:hypothetical protein INT45_003233 [Circinella minor]|uniref:Uncharacterized protein n=1 Tax=Circinella minor TaxID=1195481 RepID=A0A8H7SAM5_9FUNG|nr:hypothetical protein INT45_003233 [Circinella minor]
MDTLSNKSDHDWRNDTQSYLFDLMNDQELFKQTMHSTHPPSHYQQQNNTSATNAININNDYEILFREQYFRDACREIIQYQNRHGIKINSYKDPPEWIIQQTSNDNDKEHDRGGTWQTDKVADDHLSNLEKQWNKSNPWRKYNLQDLEFAQSLYMLESPLITLSTNNQRVLPLWTLQNRTRMLPIMKVPHIIDDSKASMQENRMDHFSMNEQQRQICIDQPVFDELNQLILDPFDNKCSTIKSSNNLPSIWSGFSQTALFDKESFSRSWISHSSLENNLSLVSINNNTTKDKSNTINNDNNNIIFMEDSHTLESATTYSNLDYDSVLMDSITGNNDEKQNQEHGFINREYNNITATNSLSPLQSDTENKRTLPTTIGMVSKYSQQQHNHNKPTSTIIIGTAEEDKKECHDVVNVEPSMYVDALVGIRRVNEYAGKRRKLNGLTSEDAITVHNKRRKQDSVSSVDYYNTNSSRASSPDIQQQQHRRKLHCWETSPSKETLSAISNSPTPIATAPVSVTKTGSSTPESQKERSNSPASSHISTIIKQNTMESTPVATHPHRPFTRTPASPTRSVLRETNSSLMQHERATPSIGTTTTHAQYPQHYNRNFNNSKTIPASNQMLRQNTSSFTKKNFTTATKALPSPPSFSTTASSLPFFGQQPESFSSEHTDNNLTHAPISNFMNSGNKNKQQHLGNHYRNFQQQQHLADSNGLFNNSPLSVSGWKLTRPSTIMPNGGFSPSANISDFVAMRKLAKKEKTNTHHHPTLLSTTTVVQGQQQHHQQANKNNRKNMPFCELRRLHDNLNEKHHFE